MEFIHQWLDAERLAPGLARGLFDGALAEFSRFVLVLLRLSGLMIIGPLFGQPALPLNVRALLVFALALIITPALPQHAARGFHKLDQNADGRLARDELPPGLAPRFDELRSGAARDDEGVRLAQYTAPASPPTPPHLLGFAALAAGELSLGVLLGLGVLTILSGLQLAGQLIDQQAGFGLGEIINPELDSSGSANSQLLYWLGLALFLLLEPLGGHLRMLQTLVQTFETLPVGAAFVSLSAIDLVGTLVQQALALGIRIVAPLAVMMSLIDLTLGFLGHSTPQVNIQAVGFATRAAVCLVILSVTLTGVTDAMASFVPDALGMLREALVYPTEGDALRLHAAD